MADCTFIRAGLKDTDYSDLTEYGLFKFNLGSDANEHQCVSFSNTVTFSAAAKTARAFGVICCLLTSFVMIQVLSLQLFLRYKREFVWKNARILALLAPLAQVLTFTAFGDDSCNASNAKCVPGAAGIIAIFNIVILMAFAFVCWLASPPEQPLFEIKHLELPKPTEEKPTTMEDIEIDVEPLETPPGNSGTKQSYKTYNDVEAQPEQEIELSFKRYEAEVDDFDGTLVSGSKRAESPSGDSLDKVVKSVPADSEYTVKSVRPISPDSEKRRQSFSPKVSPRTRRL